MRYFISTLLQYWPAKLLLGSTKVYTPLLTQNHPQPSLQSPLFKHAVATPLASLLGTLELCSTQPKLLQKKSTLRQLQTASKQLHQLIDHWTANSANAPFRVKETVTATVRLLNASHPSAKITLQYHAPEVTLLHGKVALFQDSLNNIIVNALEAYDPQEEFKTVVVLVRKREATLQIDVIDQGPGMTRIEQQLAHLKGISFKKSGSGLGLSIARFTVERMFKGRMVVDSLFGQGTRVTWLLPIYQAVAKPTNRLDERTLPTKLHS